MLVLESGIGILESYIWYTGINIATCISYFKLQEEKNCDFLSKYNVHVTPIDTLYIPHLDRHSGRSSVGVNLQQLKTQRVP